MRMTKRQLFNLIKETVLSTLEEVKFDPKILSNKERFPLFSDRVAYVSKYLRLLGEGSSRAAYLLDSKRVLKVAINAKGISQNQAELDVMTQPGVGHIVAKIFSYDPQYIWLVSEIVRPLDDENEFHDLTGVPWYFFSRFAFLTTKKHNKWQENISRVRSDFSYMDEMRFKKYIETPWFIKALDGLEKTKLVEGDIAMLSHWGKTPEQRVVLLDYGFTEDVWAQHYKFE